MADFNIRSESVDVEQIMTQIRARISEKRGVDYTEDQVRELATVRLEKFLDPNNLRSDLLDQFRRSRPAIQDDPPPVEPPYEFSEDTLFASHRGALRFMRQLLRPILKLFFNPNTLNQILHAQAQFNVDLMKREQRRRIEFDRSRADWNTLYYEVLHNLVLETTRNGIELKNIRMRNEALARRLDVSERRVRALEGVVQYRPEAVRSRPSAGSGRPDRVDGRDRNRPHRPEADAVSAEPQDEALVPTGEGAPVAGAGAGAEGRRRRRRRRGRRGSGIPLGDGAMAPEAASAGESALGADATGNDDDDGGDDNVDEANDPELTAEREPDVPSDPDAQ
jgi:transposase